MTIGGVATLRLFMRPTGDLKAVDAIARVLPCAVDKTATHYTAATTQMEWTVQTLKSPVTASDDRIADLKSELQAFRNSAVQRKDTGKSSSFRQEESVQGSRLFSKIETPGSASGFGFTAETKIQMHLPSNGSSKKTPYWNVARINSFLVCLLFAVLVRL